MYRGLIILGAIAKLGSGVGLSAICDETGLSRFKARKELKQLVFLGYVTRNKNNFTLALTGANLSIAHKISADGYYLGDYAPSYDFTVYQKGF